MALKIQPKVLSNKVIAFVAVFALVAQPVYGLISSQVANAASQVVKNTNTNEEFTTIQAAINDSDTTAGHVITVTAGTYNENVIVTKSVTIRGAQAGTDARTRSIDGAGESILNGGTQSALTIAAKDVKIDGFEVTQANGATTHAVTMTSPLGGTELSNNIVTRTGTGSAMHLYGGEGNTVQKNYLRDIAGNGIVMRNGNLATPVATNQKIVDNKIENIRSMTGGSIVVYGQTDLEIARNNITASFQGISVGAVGATHYKMNNVRVQNNTVNIVLDNTQPNVYRHAVVVEGSGEGVVIKNNNLKQTGETPVAATRYALVRISYNDVQAIDVNQTGLVIEENNLESDSANRYVVVGNNVTSQISVSNNWWGNQADPSSKIDNPSATIVSSPWLCQPFEQGSTASVAGNCAAPALAVPTGLRYESPVRDCGAVTNINYSKPAWDAIPGATYEYQALFNGSVVYGPVSFATNQHPGGQFGGGQNGEWAFQVRSVNSDGVKSVWSSSCTITLDTSAPSAPVTKVNGLTGTIYTNQNSILTSWTQPSGDPLKYNYASWHNIAAQPYNTEAGAYQSNGITSLTQSGTFPFGEGKYSVKVQAIDQAENLSAWSNTVQVVYDKTAPSIAGAAVEKTITNEAQIKVTGTVKDTNLKDYNIRVYKADKSAQVSPSIAYTGTANIESGTLATLNVSALADGDYLVRVWADDLAGNRTGIASHIYVPFTLDTKAPEAALAYSNNNGNALTKNNVLVTLTANEAVKDIAGWNRVGSSSVFTKEFTDNGKFNVTIVDLAGNSLIKSGEVKRIDRNAPTISGVTNGTTVNTPVFLSIFDPKYQGVDGFSEVDGLTVNGTVVPTAPSANKTYLRTISTDGRYTVVATDKAGNASTITFTIDSVAPAVTVQDIAAITVGGTATVTGTVNDSSVNNVEIFVDGNSVGTTSVVAGGFNFDVTGLAVGSHTVTAKAVDTASNIGTSTAKTVVVNAATVISPASVSNGLVTFATSPVAQSNANIAITDNNVATETDDAEVLGESTQNKANDDTKEVLAATTTPEVKGASDFAPFGIAWYWWLLLVTALGAAAWWFIAAARRRQSEEA